MFTNKLTVILQVQAKHLEYSSIITLCVFIGVFRVHTLFLMVLC